MKTKTLLILLSISNICFADNVINQQGISISLNDCIKDNQCTPDLTSMNERQIEHYFNTVDTSRRNSASFRQNLDELYYSNEYDTVINIASKINNPDYFVKSLKTLSSIKKNIQEDTPANVITALKESNADRYLYSQYLSQELQYSSYSTERMEDLARTIYNLDDKMITEEVSEHLLNNYTGGNTGLELFEKIIPEKDKTSKVCNAVESSLESFNEYWFEDCENEDHCKESVENFLENERDHYSKYKSSYCFDGEKTLDALIDEWKEMILSDVVSFYEDESDEREIITTRQTGIDRMSLDTKLKVDSKDLLITAQWSKTCPKYEVDYLKYRYEKVLSLYKDQGATHLIQDIDHRKDKCYLSIMSEYL